MGAGFSTNAMSSSHDSNGLPTIYPPPPPTTHSHYLTAAPLPPPRQSNYAATLAPSVRSFNSEAPVALSPTNYRRVGLITAFHSSSKWKRYLEASKSSNKLIVIDFTAAWCGPCRRMENFLNELAAKYADVEFVKIDVDELMSVARDFEVRVMPTFVFIQRGEQIDKVVGAKREDLKMKLDKHRLKPDLQIPTN